MTYKEIPGQTPYETQVLSDLKFYSEGYSSLFNPLTKGVFTLATEKGRMPLWGQSFAEKGIKPKKSGTVTLGKDQESELTDLGVPREFCGLRLEREQITDEFDNRALVERTYGIKANGEEMLCVVTTASKNIDPLTHKNGQYSSICVQVPGHKDWINGFRKLSTLKRGIKNPRPLWDFVSWNQLAE